MLPLADLTVIDLTRAVAGPFCTMNLGDLGARVLKIEEPGMGDETRQWGPPFVGDHISTYFLGMNRNKQSIAADLKQPAGRDLVRGLARSADVVVENFRTGVADRLGVGYTDLARENPRIIYLSISGFGSEGPGREKAGYDLIIQAMSGLMLASAYPDGPPGKTATPIADLLAALFGSQAILAAVHRRHREGVGARIEISLLDALLAGMAPFTSSYLMTGREPKAAGTTQANIAPYQVFACRDGSIATGALNDRQWVRFVQALEQPVWLEDPRFPTNPLRVEHRVELTALIEAVLVTKSVAEWVSVLERHDLPCGPVLSIGQVLNSPVVTERQVIREVPHRSLGSIRTIANPCRFADLDLEYAAPPALGEHNPT